jgi:hypothetical protein
MTQIPCRHRGAAVAPDVHGCESPRFVGLKLVSAVMCRECHYRDHEPDPRSGAPGLQHLLPCMHLGPRLEQSPAASLCSHPRHGTATESLCRTCPDYLYPVVTPLTPAARVREMLDLPPREQQHGWWSWANVQEALRQGASATIAQALLYPGSHAGRGVVIVGGGKYFAAAYVTIRVLRHVGCRLPIQLWHLAGEMDEPMRRLVQPHGVTCVDADHFAERQPFRFLHGHWWKGWQLKPYAVAHSPFREVLYLDADCYPTRDPEFLFDWPPYRQHGAIFWPDLPSSHGLLPAGSWEIFGTTPGGLPLESGQFVIDKQQCWPEMQLTLWYNARADLLYHLLWGDKDTFNIAWRRLGKEFSMPSRHCGWETHTILQYGPGEEVLFQHRCQDKFRLLAGDFETTRQMYKVNRFQPRLLHEERCFQFLEELRLAWPEGYASAASQRDGP